MTTAAGLICGGLLAALMLFGAAPQRVWATDGSCSEAIEKIDAQSAKLSNDLHHIQREVAALKAELVKPGMKDVFAGLGYIFGLFGTALFVASRRKG